MWESDQIRAPLATVPLTLPWVSSPNYSWYARVRASSAATSAAWSDKFGFNLRSPSPPASLSAGVVNPRPGLVRWTPVAGATAYEVSFITDPTSGTSKKIKSATTAADLREYYSFHNDPSFFDNGISAVEGEVWWRVRAVREVFGTPMNNIKVVSYGPWSTLFKTVEPPVAATTIALTDTVSRSRASDIVISDLAGGPSNEAHELAPAFSWTGSLSLAPGLYGDCPGLGRRLPHVPRLRLHGRGLLESRARLRSWSEAPHTSRASPGHSASRQIPPRSLEPPAFISQTPRTEGGVHLRRRRRPGQGGWDRAGSRDRPGRARRSRPRHRTERLASATWTGPNGRYYWTAVPAVPYLTPDSTIEYHDVEFAEDMCAAGEVLPFGKTSEPVTERESGVPFISGMSADGKLRTATTATPSFFGRVVVAWKPALGARKYEVQWSLRASPWKTAGSLKTPATAALLRPRARSLVLSRARPRYDPHHASLRDDLERPADGQDPPAPLQRRLAR